MAGVPRLSCLLQNPHEPLPHRARGCFAALLLAVHFIASSAHQRFKGSPAPADLRAQLRRNVTERSLGPGCTVSGRRVGVLTFNNRRGNTKYEMATVINTLYTHVR